MHPTVETSHMRIMHDKGTRLTRFKISREALLFKPLLYLMQGGRKRQRNVAPKPFSRSEAFAKDMLGDARQLSDGFLLGSWFDPYMGHSP